MDRQGLRKVVRPGSRGAARPPTRPAGQRRARRRGLWLLASLLAAGAAGASPVEYLYVEPNEGTASGGHVALRIGERVHHYQHADGALRSSRVHADWFRYLYSVLQNRTIHVARLDVDDATREALARRFGARAAVEEQHFAEQRALASDRWLLARMRAAEAGGGGAPDPAAPRLRGAGYFFAPGGRAAAGVEPRIGALRDRLLARRGDDWLARRRRAVVRELEDLDPRRFPAPPTRLAADRLPRRRPRFSERAVQLTLQRLALEVIEHARPLRGTARIAPTDPRFVLDDAERRGLERYATRLEGEIEALLDSPRPDWGYPLLVGLARRVVVEQSLATGRWVVLDTFPADAVAIPARTLATRAAFLAELQAHAREELAGERAHWAARRRVDERAYQAVEEAINRSVEIDRGLGEERDIRVHGERLVPHGELGGDLPWLPGLRGPLLGAALDEARRREAAHARALDSLYRYDLLRRNCVTEIFATIDDTFPPAEQERRLGGRVAPGAGLNFWPAFAFRAVRRTWRVSELGEIPSYRRTRLAQMDAREHPIRVHLREASTLTSSVYRPNPGDSFFLFFTRDAWLPRPLYGLANLLAGAGQAALGLGRLPFDGGETLVAGARGMVFSVPELAFVSLRKGTLEYARSSDPRTAFRALPTPPR